MKADKIPKGLYCYDKKGTCRYWSRRGDLPKQADGYCAYLDKSDVELTEEGGFSLLWDMVKECGVNEG